MSMLNFEAWENSLAGKFWNADGNPDAWRPWLYTFFKFERTDSTYKRFHFNNVIFTTGDSGAFKGRGPNENWARWYRLRGWPKGWMKHLLKPVAKEA